MLALNFDSHRKRELLRFEDNIDLDDGKRGCEDVKEGLLNCMRLGYSVGICDDVDEFPISV
jgi:hypothetical protein